MDIVGVIPARFNSSRLPGKLLKKIGDKAIIEHVCENVEKSNLKKFYVLTDDEKIANLLKDRYNVIMTSSDHESGTSRITEVINQIECDYIINIQGDEPFFDSKTINEIINKINNDYDVFSLKTKIKEKEEIENINNVKVVCNKKEEALYFSRSKIPYDREAYEFYYKHIGIYIYSKEFITNYKNIKNSQIANAESLEQLNFLYEGYKIKMINIDYIPIGIDTEDDLIQARKVYNENK